MTDRPGDGTAVTVSRATNADILQTVVQMRLDMTGTFARLIEQVSGLGERMEKLEEKVDAQHQMSAEQEAQHRVMRQTVTRLEDDMRDLSHRLRDVERFKWQASAIGAAAGFAGGLLWELLLSRVL